MRRIKGRHLCLVARLRCSHGFEQILYNIFHTTHTQFYCYLLCCGYIISYWLIYQYLLGLLHWHSGPWAIIWFFMFTRQAMMTSSNGNIFRVTGPLCGEFTGPGEFPTQRPVTRSFDVFFDLRLNKRLSKQPWGWWFETLSWSLWRQCNGACACNFITQMAPSSWLVLIPHLTPMIFKAKTLSWIKLLTSTVNLILYYPMYSWKL